MLFNRKSLECFLYIEKLTIEILILKYSLPTLPPLSSLLYSFVLSDTWLIENFSNSKLSLHNFTIYRMSRNFDTRHYS